MRVSVIIPTYNSGPLVEEAIASVLAQTHPAAQIIVVDDGSTDDTPRRVEQFGQRIEYVRQPNGRVAAARNTGLARATGDAVAFLDADDAWHPRKLERQVEVLTREPHIGLLATRLSPWPGEFTPADQLVTGNLLDVPLVSLLVFNSLATSSIIVRRAVLDQAGRFDSDLFGPEDYDLWLRCARIARAAVLEEPLTGYRDTSGSVGKQADSMRQGLLRIHAKLDAAGAWPSRWLRRKCRAHIDYTTGFMYLAAGKPGRATQLIAHSLATFPLPMRPAEVRYRWGRLRLLARSLWASCLGRAS
jgi:glycosyltransferase involved in cell wall biosynthesis